MIFDVYDESIQSFLGCFIPIFYKSSFFLA